MSESQETAVRLRLPLTGWVILITALVTAVTSYTVTQAQLQEHARDLVRIEAKASIASSDATQVRVLIERIDERTAETKRQLDRIFEQLKH